MKEKLYIHDNIIKNLDYFLEIKKIPNILFMDQVDVVKEH